MSKELLDCPYLLDHLEHPHYLALCNPEAMCRKASSDAVQLTLLRGLARFKLFLGAFLILSGFAHQMMVVMVMVQQIVGQVGQDLLASHVLHKRTLIGIDAKKSNSHTDASASPPKEDFSSSSSPPSSPPFPSVSCSLFLMLFSSCPHNTACVLVVRVVLSTPFIYSLLAGGPNLSACGR